MPRPDPPDAQVTARLAALELAVGARRWVPQQPGLVADAAPGEPPVPTDTGRGGVPPRGPSVAAAGATVAGGARSGGPVGQVLAGWAPQWARDVSAVASPAALATLAAVCAGCVLVTAYLLLHRPSAPVPEALPAATVPMTTAPPSPAGIVVDVGGRVRRPGLVTLPAGARVADALHAAGGVLRHRDVANLNLAARVADGQLLLVGAPGGAPVAGADIGGSATGAGGPAAPVNLNTATLDALDTLPGIGPVLAQRIIDWRTAHGGFGAVADLNDVSGIGESTFADISPLVTV